MSGSDFKIIKADISQLDEQSVDEFCRLRTELFMELGEISRNTDISKLKSVTEQYYLSHINKDLICYGIFPKGKLAATGSLCLFNRIPYEENLTGLEGYILNIYTCPPFRNHGFANLILDKIIEYAQKNHIKRLWLNSSQQAKGLYGKRGFTAKSNEMELLLP